MSQPDFLLANNAVYVAQGEVPQVNFLGPLFVPKGEAPPKNGQPLYAVGKPTFTLYTARLWLLDAHM